MLENLFSSTGFKSPIFFISIGVTLLQSEAFHSTHTKNCFKAFTLIYCNPISCHCLWYRGIATKNTRIITKGSFWSTYFFKYMIYSGVYTGQESMSHIKNICLRLCHWNFVGCIVIMH